MTRQPIHAVDVGISVETGVDIAKQVADIVFLRKDLLVLKQGIQGEEKLLLTF